MGVRYNQGMVKHLVASVVVSALLFAPQLATASGAASTFPEPLRDEVTTAKGTETLVLAGGCFWGVEAVFDRLKGVTDVVSGYAGGSKASAHYEIVSLGITGHAESVRITYEPAQITLGQLLKVFFAVAHDPTQLNRQGPDDGTQYRSSIFFANDEQKQVALAYIAQLDAANVFKRKIVTKVVPLDGFYPAEAYHQNFLDRNPAYPYIVYNDLPKLEHLKREFPSLMKPGATTSRH
jgi:peptide-methionine (S)-S-oxide reductase